MAVLKLRQLLPTTILTLGIGFLSHQPVDAKNPSFTPSISDSENSSFILAQLLPSSSPLYIHWKLKHSARGILHESDLIMNGYYGKMKTKYFNPSTGKTETVEQTMKLTSSSQGLIIVGSNPVYAGTSIKHRSYSPDNIGLQIDTDGNFNVVTCDQQQICSMVDIEVIR